VSKRAAQKVDTGRFNVKKLNEGDVKEDYQVTIRNKFPAVITDVVDAAVFCGEERGCSENNTRSDDGGSTDCRNVGEFI
jgi:hypothetical protein